MNGACALPDWRAFRWHRCELLQPPIHGAIMDLLRCAASPLSHGHLRRSAVCHHGPSATPNLVGIRHIRRRQVHRATDPAPAWPRPMARTEEGEQQDNHERRRTEHLSSCRLLSSIRRRSSSRATTTHHTAAASSIVVSISGGNFFSETRSHFLSRALPPWTRRTLTWTLMAASSTSHKVKGSGGSILLALSKVNIATSSSSSSVTTKKLTQLLLRRSALCLSRSSISFMFYFHVLLFLFLVHLYFFFKLVVMYMNIVYVQLLVYAV